MRTAVKVDDSELLAACTITKNLVGSFRKRFTLDNFFEVFGFIHNYINLEASTQLAQFYAVDIYAHFCARAKLTVD